MVWTLTAVGLSQETSNRPKAKKSGENKADNGIFTKVWYDE